MSVFHFICKHCGPSEKPCEHALDLIELRFLREMQETNQRNFRFIEAALLEIIHILNRPQSATLRLIFNPSSGVSMPKTVAVGVVAQAVFQEFDGPNGTGNPVPAAGPVNFASDNTAVATVDASGAVTAVAAGTANISGTDSVNNLTASDSLTVTAAVPGPAVSATLTLQ